MVVADRVVVELEARTGQYERNLRNAETIATRTTRGIASSFRMLGGVLAGFGVAFGASAVIQMSSAWTDLNSRVALAAGSIERGGAVMDRLGVIARRTYSSLNQTAESYLQNSTSLRELGYSTQQQLDLTEALNNALVISATRGDRARTVMEAWSRAMALGELRGQNLNTIIQNGGRLTEALAQSMGVSTNELRSLGEQGRITTREMFGVTSQMEQLRREADAMPATIEDAFGILGDEIFKFIGQADTATEASANLAEHILNLAGHIGTLSDRFVEGELPIQRFLNAVRDISREAGRAVGADQIGKGIRAAFEGVVDSIEATEVALTDAEQALVNFGANTRGAFGEMQPVVDDLIQQLLEGRGTAESAAEAIRLIGAEDDFGNLISGLQGVVDTLFSVRDAAIVARNITSDLGQFPSSRAFSRAFPPDLSSDGRPGGPVAPTPRTTGQSPEQRFATALEQQRRQITMLEEETAVRAGLNPLVNDYGYALERLRVQQDLENEATRAGLTLTEDRVAAIAALADEYAAATVEAARLNESQAELKKTVEEWAGVMQQATRGFIDDLIEGKDAAEAFGSVLRNIGNQLINMGLGSLFSSSNVGGLFNFGGPRARGGPVSSGRSYLVGERGPELFTPSSAGHITANDQMGGGGVTVQMTNDFRGVDPASVARIEAGLDKLAANIVPTIRREIAVGPKKGRR